MSEVAREVQADGAGLTFDWRRGARRPFWLLFFLVLSVVLHIGGFYFFQVVYPPQKRELLRPVEVTLLDPADPKTSAVLSRIDDRVVAYDARGSLEVPGEVRSATEVRFRPSFEGYEPELRDLPPIEGKPPRLFEPGTIYLPPFTTARPLPSAVTPQTSLRPVLSLRWSGAERQVLQPFSWEPNEPVARPADSDHVVFHIGIDPQGRVVHSLPERSAGAEMDGALFRALRAMRFAPSTSGETDWAWADVRW